MHEVEVGGVRDFCEPGMRAHEANAIPSGMRNAHRTAELADASSVQAETRRLRVLVAALEEELHPDAEAEQRNAALADDPHHCHVETKTAKLASAVAEAPDAGEHHRACGQKLVLAPGHKHVGRAGALQPHLAVGTVADPETDDRHHPIRPFELASPTL